MEQINLRDKFELVNEYWSPKIVGELNGQYVKLAKFKGEFTWHHHEHEDEFFLVVKGAIDIHFRDKTVHLKEGEFCTVPKGVEHKPEAQQEAHVLLFEPQSTLNTGEVQNDFTREQLGWI